MTYVPLAAHIRRVLDEWSTRGAPNARFEEELQDYMTAKQADQTLRAVTQWGRVAELFAYNEKDRVFDLDDGAN